MYSKMSIRNVKRSFKDYVIYFLTLTFAVCIFYSFNSISSQKAMMDVTNSKAEIIQMLSKIISMTSVFVSIILGFLIIYANNFLIKRRKREIGLYMTLGMGKRKISYLLIKETFLIGLLSLGFGLIAGVVVSQGLSLFTSKLFEVNVSKFNFVFSPSAAIKTSLYFGIIFILVMIFNTLVISKYKLIDLLRAGRKNESIKIKSTKVSFLLFLLSIILIGVAYLIILKFGFDNGISYVQVSVILGIVGTVLLFLSLSGFLINALEKSEKFYLRNLNMFVLRQINSKVNTTYISMSVISLMLFLTITLLSTGVSFKNSLQTTLKNNTPYDVTFYSFSTEDEEITNISKSLDKIGLDYNNTFREYLSYNLYTSDEGIKQYIYNYGNDKVKKNLDFYDKNLDCIAISDYNKLRAMAGESTFNPQKDEVILISNVNDYDKAVNKFIENNKTIRISNNDYRIINEKALKDNLETSALATKFMVAVLPDEVVKDMEISTTYLSGNYKEKSEKIENEIYDVFAGFTTRKYSYDEYGFVLGETRDMAYDASVGMSVTVMYIGIYLGVIFLISSTAILALQQLSEASDNIERYEVLKKIGTSSKNINKAVFSQVFIYFMMPLTIAIIHSIVGIIVASKVISMFGASSILVSAIITAIIIIMVYGGYFLTTYVGYKNIIKVRR
ncbi:ABC transporter permease [Clostridium paraputrificum]|uniref:ABC transporter permease n=2 Tax=Clostridium TaxID=1485 RepID=UPI0018A04AEC|nr:MULTISPECIES: ABC transporter permease [Clostridium]MDB2075842.1 ABC transporter permease [Clostridium paraputrificum]MDB2078794.1 ABC transporter permease [Clostridium paraputrificum]MDB2092518.1 ABC transporter permease [Clostridium paraputrificum]MDB2100737.1 ABC transporter permease [Clostridium paraputrificum]MDU2284496.1 ABC transporter permease [Clostridium sp.]